MQNQTGKCQCGAVSFTVASDRKDFEICHCGMCRRWTGGPNLSLHIKPDALSLTGEDHVETYVSSEWAERAFCKTCGSSLYYRLTAEGPAQGDLHIPIGLLDNLEEYNLAAEIYYDHKPDAYNFEGNSQKVTEAEIIAMFTSGSA